MVWRILGDLQVLMGARNWLRYYQNSGSNTVAIIDEIKH